MLLLQLISKRTNWEVRFASEKGAYVQTLPVTSFKELINQRIRWASNASYQLKLNFPFFSLLCNTFILNSTILAYLVVSIINPSLILNLILPLAVKALADVGVIYRGAMLYNRLKIVRYFFAWFLIIIPYTVSMGILGVLGYFSWKSRKSRFSRVANSGRK